MQDRTQIRSLGSDHTLVKPRPGGNKGLFANPQPAPNEDKTQFQSPATSASPTTYLGSEDSQTIAQAAGPIFSLLDKLRQLKRFDHIDSLHAEAIGLIQHFDTQLRRQNMELETTHQARYCLCTMVDEAVLNTPWGSESLWSTQSMLSTFHKETYGGEHFFHILDHVMNRGESHAPLLELLYLCLALGFKGKYRLDNEGQVKLETLQDRAYRQLKEYQGEPVVTLSPDWENQIKSNHRLSEYLPPWVVAAFAGLVILSAYLMFSFKLNEASDQLFNELANTLSKPAPIAQAKTTQDDFLHLQQLLQSEISRHLISVVDNSTHISIMINAENLFPSGSAEVNPDYEPVLAKVARTVESLPGQVLVVGHTDDQPIFSARYPSNWHLSLARANAVVKALDSSANLQGRLIPEGKGAGAPLVPNDSASNRAINRRVNIDIYRM